MEMLQISFNEMFRYHCQDIPNCLEWALFDLAVAGYFTEFSNVEGSLKNLSIPQERLSDNGPNFKSKKVV